MMMWKTTLASSVLCIGVATAILWRAADCPAEPLPRPSVAEPRAAEETADAPPVALSLERIAVPKCPPSVPPTPDAARRLRRALADGALPSPEVQLPDGEAWDRFSALWDELSVAVRRAEERRDEIGKRLSRARLASGDCVRIPDEGMEKDAQGHSRPAGAWRERRHPQEWVTTRYSYREGEGQVAEQVRLMPGENQDLDTANMELALAVDMRSDAVRRFFAQFTNQDSVPIPSSTSVEEKDR